MAICYGNLDHYVKYVIKKEAICKANNRIHIFYIVLYFSTKCDNNFCTKCNPSMTITSICAQCAAQCAAHVK